jgi:hypothetical protein
MIKNWLDKPVTWRRYFKMCGICSIISIIYCIWLYVKIGLIELPKIKIPFLKKKEDEEE